MILNKFLADLLSQICQGGAGIRLKQAVFRINSTAPIPNYVAQLQLHPTLIPNRLENAIRLGRKLDQFCTYSSFIRFFFQQHPLVFGRIQNRLALDQGICCFLKFNRLVREHIRVRHEIDQLGNLGLQTLHNGGQFL